MHPVAPMPSASLLLQRCWTWSGSRRGMRLLRLRLLGRGPAGQQPQRVPGGRTGLGGVDEERQPGVGREIQALVHKTEVPDRGVPELLESGVMLAHVGGRPPGAELLTARGKFPDEVGQATVEGVTAGLGPQDRHRVIRGALPVRVEPVGTVVQEDERAWLAGRTGLAYISECSA